MNIQTNDNAIVDAEYFSRRLVVFKQTPELNLKDNDTAKSEQWIVVSTTIDSDHHIAVFTCDTEQEMIDNIEWKAWMLQGVKDKELAKKLEERI